jgi:Raf kinase inhibitor-like YbhB/YbcL family protein
MKKTNLLLIFGVSILVFALIGCLVLYLLGPADGEAFSAITEEAPIIEATPFPSPSESASPSPTIVEAPMNLTSAAFANGEPIPAKYSCKGDDISPALAWTEPPAGTQSFALIMDDPDAPAATWDHWVLFNIPAETRALAENIQIAAPIIVGRNSWGRNKYGGPCPPSGTHRYFFKLYALDTTLTIPANSYKDAVLAAMEGHILAQAELMGTFSK